MHLTTTGRVVLVAGVAALLGGIALGQPVVAAVGAFGVVLVAAAALVVSKVPDVHLARAGHPAEVERGESAHVRLSFRSASKKHIRRVIVVERVAGEARTAVIGPITPAGYDHLTYAVATTRRGIITCGPAVVRHFDPFGLVTADRRFTSTCTVSVRPRIHPLPTLPPGRQRDLEGPTRERSEGSASFHQLRAYVPGDDLRRIHWRSTARTGNLLVKQMVDTTRPDLVLVLDNRATAIAPDDFETAVDIAASIQTAADSEGFPSTLLFADGTGELDTDGKVIAPLDRLTSVALSDTDSLARLADVLSSRGRSLVFVTGEPSADDLFTLTRLARGFAPAVLVSVAAERRAPVAAPKGVRPIACTDGEDFVAQWALLR